VRVDGLAIGFTSKGKQNRTEKQRLLAAGQYIPLHIGPREYRSRVLPANVPEGPFKSNLMLPYRAAKARAVSSVELGFLPIATLGFPREPLRLKSTAAS